MSMTGSAARAIVAQAAARKVRRDHTCSACMPARISRWLTANWQRNLQPIRNDIRTLANPAVSGSRPSEVYFGKREQKYVETKSKSTGTEDFGRASTAASLAP